jgi:hypothetical protein
MPRREIARNPLRIRGGSDGVNEEGVVSTQFVQWSEEGEIVKIAIE